MHARENTDGTLILTYDASRWAKGFFGAAAVLLAVAGYDYFSRPRAPDRMTGLLAGAGFCALFGLALDETASVRVDPATQTIAWRRRIAFWRREGTLSFGEVRDVFLESPIGASKVPSKRISLLLANGKLLPLTFGCDRDVDGRTARAAALLRRTIGQAEDRSASATARTLVEHGRFTEAMRLLVTSDGMCITEARQQVDAMKEGVGLHDA